MQKHTGWILALLCLALLLQTGCAAAPDARPHAAPPIDDKGITSRVIAELARDPDTRVAQIQVETFRGVVQLTGFAADQRVIVRAGEIARRVEGVRRVQNNLILR